MSDPPNPEKVVVADAVRGLERELVRHGRRRWLQRGIAVALVAAIGGGGYFYREATKPPPPARYTTEKVEQRDIFEEVQATGKVKPLTEVEVGAQVSGRIVEVFVDFNSRVKKGDKLAEIDPRLFGAQVGQIQAQLDAAKASVKRAEASFAAAVANLKRLEMLAREKLATPAEIDQARGTHDVARADVAASKANLTQLRAQLSSATTTLQYTQINSPIDGVVVDRAVNPGQTVASSFAAPVLFVIAEDLSKMQVLADIDEADVGKLEEDMTAKVVVDAFPGDEFSGRVTQIRYSPTEVQGVVTYSAVIDVDNPELKLRPGMTATVTVRTSEIKGVSAVPNAALRFRPLRAAKPDESSEEAPAFTEEIEHGQARLFVPAGGPQGDEKVREVVIDVGVTDGVWTELRGDGLRLGSEVVTEQREKPKKKKFLGVF